ncbi:hypothetical protein [Epilithonimonas vandammei]|nr:hypothetical protein [Epilithonimonas vandammei]
MKRVISNKILYTGSDSFIAAGAVVRKNVPANVMVAGIPAVVKKELL